MLKVTLPFFLVLALACSGENVKKATSTVVGKTVESTKGVASGVTEGIEEGRKAGSSVDGAMVVSTIEELNASGGVSVYAVVSVEGGSEVVVAFENKADTPMRITGLEVMALDSEGFVKRTSTPAGELTIPSKAKDRASFRFDLPAEDVGGVRVWGQEMTVPAPQKPAAAPEAEAPEVEGPSTGSSTAPGG